MDVTRGKHKALRIRKRRALALIAAICSAAGLPAVASVGSISGPSWEQPERASADDFDDFLSPASSKTPEQLLEIRGETRVDPADEELGPGSFVVLAQSVQDAINRAMQDQRERNSAAPLDRSDRGERRDESPIEVDAARPALVSGSMRFIETPSGLGAVGHARVRNPFAEAQNRNLRLWGRRLAAVRAVTEAKLQIAQALQAAPISGSLRLVNETRQADGLTPLGERVARTTLEEEMSKVVGTFIRGAVVYHTEEHDGGDEISVWVATTHRSQGRVQVADGGNAVVARTLKDGLDAIIAEAQTQVTPPTGGRMIVSAEDGRVAWVGFGSAVMPEADNARLEARLAEGSKLAARLRAETALVGMMNGERIDVGEDIEVSFEQVLVEDRRVIGGTNGFGDLDAAVRVVRAKRQLEQRVEGDVPAGTRTLDYVTADGDWAWAISVYVDASIEAGEELRDALSDAPVVQDGIWRRAPN